MAQPTKGFQLGTNTTASAVPSGTNKNMGGFEVYRKAFFFLFSALGKHTKNNLNAMATFHGQTCHLPTNKDVNLSIAGGQEHDKQRRDQDLLSLTLFPTYPCVTTLREFPW